MTTSSSEPDRRYAPRRRVLKGAMIVFNGNNSTLPCRVKNLSETGAQLEFDGSCLLAIPDTFDLIIELDAIRVPCSVARRQGVLVGVRFEGPMTKRAPTRAQVVQVSVPQPTPSLRKKPITR